jgi:gliding motility-associated-like protein
MKKIISSIIFLTTGFLINAQIPTDIPLELRAQFNGQYGYTVIGNTLNEFDNKQSPSPPCQMLTESSAELNMLPSQTIVAAYLYWSGIGNGTENTLVSLNGEAITADDVFVVDPSGTGVAIYFGSFKDITPQVNTIGNNTYNFSNLNFNPIPSVYCNTDLYYAGWSILVVYEEMFLPVQQVNIYDGLLSLYNISQEDESKSISIGNLNVTDTSNATISYLAWNGSSNLFFNESIAINESILSNAINPADNPFNSTNSYTGANVFWNMDLDVFDVSSFIQVGDTEAVLTFTSLYTRLIQNVVTVIPSELPDTTVALVAVNNQDPCDDRDISLNININNFNSFEVLPANTPYSIFALDANDEEVFIATFFTQNALPIDGTETQTVAISIPNTIPNSTTLIIKANTLQDASNPINESNSLNNVVTLPLILPQTPSITIPPTDISLCGSIADNTAIDLTQNNLTSLGVANPTEYSISYHLSDAEAQNGSNAIANPSSFIATSNPQTLFIRIESNLSPNCFAITDFEVSYAAIPQIQQTLDINECQIGAETVFFDLTLNNAVSMGIADPTNVIASYHNTLADAQDNSNPISNVTAFNAGATTTTIYVRVQNSNNASCFSTASFQLNIFTVTIGEAQDLTAEACTSLRQDAVFDLTVNTPLALSSQSPQDFSVSYHRSENEAQNGSNAIVNPEAYTSTALSQTIWLRLTLDTAPTACAALGSFTLQTEPLTVVNNVSDLSIQACVFPNAPVSFDLTQNTAIAIGNQDPQLFDISYHTSEANAENGTNAIVAPSNYENASNPQILWLRLERNDILPICYAITPFDIEVVGTPEINFNPEPLQICASDSTGFSTFNLDQSSADITFNNPNIAVSFHLNLADAQSNANTLPLTFTNTVANMQSIYFRTQDMNSSCSFAGSLDLQVLAIPQLSDNPASLSACAITSTSGIFDLTEINTSLIENNADANFDVSYFLTESDALNATDPITDPNNFSSTTNPQTLWLRVGNANNCSSIASFELDVLTSTLISETVIDEIVVCSESETELLATINLSIFNSTTAPNATANTVVKYYEGWVNFDLGVAIENPESYIATAPNTTIIAHLFDTETLCSSPIEISFNVVVNPLPAFSLPSTAQICIDAETNELINQSFSPPILDTNLPNTSNLNFQWSLNNQPLTQNTPSLTATSAGNYTVTVTDVNTGCNYSQSTLVEAVNPPLFSVAVLSPAFSNIPQVEVQNISGQGIFEFRLDDGFWQLLDEGETQLRFSNLADGTHTITGRDLFGCGSNTVAFTVLRYPPFFTPNGDGTNEFWNILSLSDQPNACVSIFDRYGKLLYVGKPQQGGWDGTYQGQQMPTSDYWFKVAFTDPKTDAPAVFASHFSLKR